MLYVPYERMSINWSHQISPAGLRLTVTLPWLSIDIDIKEDDEDWIRDATTCLHTDPSNPNVQKFIKELKDYPVFYIQPRSLSDFKDRDLQEAPDLAVDTTTPTRLIETFGCPIGTSIRGDVIPAWTWDWEKILNKARIQGTDLYDPLSFVTYLICYRLEQESTGWVGQDEFGAFMGNLLEKDEQRFFQAIGWVTKQAWYITSAFCSAMEPALVHFSKAKDLIEYYIADEVGHHKFMEQVFKDLDLKKEDFPIEGGSKWLLAAHKHVAVLSPLAFTAMINIFEVVYNEGQEPTARVLRLSSRPHAARGYDLHHKINIEHRHCDMPFNFASYLAPQPRNHALLTLGLFEITLNLFDRMEQQLVKELEISDNDHNFSQREVEASKIAAFSSL